MFRLQSPGPGAGGSAYARRQHRPGGHQAKGERVLLQQDRGRHLQRADANLRRAVPPGGLSYQASGSKDS